jgi:hypothetical protein
MTAAMMAGFASELTEIEKQAGLGKWLTGAALAGSLATGVKAAPKMLNKAAPAITHTVPRPVPHLMGMSRGQMADPAVAGALSFR